MPEPVAVIPSPFSSNRPDVIQYLVYIGGNRFQPAVGKTAVGGYIYMRQQSIISVTRNQRIFPAGYHVVLLYLLEGQLHRFFVSNGFNPEQLLEVVCTGHYLHVHTVYQVGGQLV